MFSFAFSIWKILAGCIEKHTACGVLTFDKKILVNNLLAEMTMRRNHQGVFIASIKRSWENSSSR